MDTVEYRYRMRAWGIAAMVVLVAVVLLVNDWLSTHASCAIPMPSAADIKVSVYEKDDHLWLVASQSHGWLNEQRSVNRLAPLRPPLRASCTVVGDQATIRYGEQEWRISLEAGNISCNRVGPDAERVLIEL